MFVKDSHPQRPHQQQQSQHQTNKTNDITIPIIPKTMNIWWLLSALLCVWFLWIHTPPFLMQKEKEQLYVKLEKPVLYIHLLCVYSIYSVCVHNTLFTPSTTTFLYKNGESKPLHIWFGRIGFLLGYIGFISGCYLTWIILDWRDDIGFSIGITIGGFSQMWAQMNGHLEIRKYQQIKNLITKANNNVVVLSDEDLLVLEKKKDTHLENHILNMIGLFVLACGIPAMIRLGTVLGNNYLPFLILGQYYAGYKMAEPFVKKIKDSRYRRMEEEGYTSL